MLKIPTVPPPAPLGGDIPTTLTVDPSLRLLKVGAKQRSSGVTDLSNTGLPMPMILQLATIKEMPGITRACRGEGRIIR